MKGSGRKGASPIFRKLYRHEAAGGIELYVNTVRSEKSAIPSRCHGKPSHDNPMTKRMRLALSNISMIAFDMDIFSIFL